MQIRLLAPKDDSPLSRDGQGTSLALSSHSPSKSFQSLSSLKDIMDTLPEKSFDYSPSSQSISHKKKTIRPSLNRAGTKLLGHHHRNEHGKDKPNASHTSFANLQKSRKKNSSKRKVPKGLSPLKHLQLLSMLDLILIKQEKNEKLPKVVRRKSCNCSWCGGTCLKEKKWDCMQVMNGQKDQDTIKPSETKLKESILSLSPSYRGSKYSKDSNRPSFMPQLKHKLEHQMSTLTTFPNSDRRISAFNRSLTDLKGLISSHRHRDSHLKNSPEDSKRAKKTKSELPLIIIKTISDSKPVGMSPSAETGVDNKIKDIKNGENLPKQKNFSSSKEKQSIKIPQLKIEPYSINEKIKEDRIQNIEVAKMEQQKQAIKNSVQFKEYFTKPKIILKPLRVKQLSERNLTFSAKESKTVFTPLKLNTTRHDNKGSEDFKTAQETWIWQNMKQKCLKSSRSLAQLKSLTCSEKISSFGKTPKHYKNLSSHKPTIYTNRSEDEHESQTTRNLTESSSHNKNRIVYPQVRANPNESPTMELLRKTYQPNLFKPRKANFM